MLSQAEYHLRVPKSLRKNLLYRRRLVRACKDNRLSQLAMMEACRRDILFFISAWAWQINPRHVGAEVGPFITWDFQDELVLDTLHRLLVLEDDMLWEKSREMGATWLALLIAVWLCLFHPNKRVLCISHSEQAVDRAGDEGTLFAKIRFILDHLPDWMSQGVKKRKMGFTFPGRSSISGAASTGRSGVGDRVTMVLLDEFSKQQAAREILGQTADTGPRLIIGTHYGIGTTFYELTQRPDMQKKVLHWSQHPKKKPGLYRANPEALNGVEIIDKAHHFPPDYHFVMDGKPAGGPFPGLRSPWYDKECNRRQSDRDVAMHLDIDPKGSARQFFDVITIRNLINTYSLQPYWEGDLHYDSDTGRPVALVPQQGGPLKLWVKPTADGLLPDMTAGIGADIAAGTGATPSCVLGIDCKTGEQILEYANSHIGPKELAVFTVALCWLCKSADGQGARLAWEMPGPGVTFSVKVQELGYGNIYYREKNLNLAGGGYSDTPGWFANPESIRALITEYRYALQSRECIMRSAPALEETLDFETDKIGNIIHGGAAAPDDPTAARVNHGDRVIGGALAWKMCRALNVMVGRRKAVQSDDPPRGSLAYRRRVRHNQEREEQYA